MTEGERSGRGPVGVWPAPLPVPGPLYDSAPPDHQAFCSQRQKRQISGFGTWRARGTCDGRTSVFPTTSSPLCIAWFKKNSR